MRNRERLTLGTAGLVLAGSLSGITTEAHADAANSCSVNHSGKNSQATEQPLGPTTLGIPAKFTKSQPYRGIDYLEWKTDKPHWDIHTLVVDLTTPGLRLKATPPSKWRKKVSEFAKDSGVEVAVNGDFFDIDFDTDKISKKHNRPITLAVGNGQKWPGTTDDKRFSTIQFYKNSNCVEITDKKQLVKFDKTMDGVIGGHPLLVWNGEIAIRPRIKTADCDDPNPRTAVGLSKDKRTLFMTVVEGNEKKHWGMTCYETAKFMKQIGADAALNLDGGGSSTLWIKKKGVVNLPPGRNERRVANHLGVEIGRK